VTREVPQCLVISTWVTRRLVFLRLFTLGSTFVVFAIAASSAAAGSGGTARTVYSGVAGNTQSRVLAANHSGPSAASGQLPFTGVNLALAAAVVVALLVGGLALRRAGNAG
jgi:hypothetical protein